jgi:tellurite resistance-related uncharacterized protein
VRDNRKDNVHPPIMVHHGKVHQLLLSNKMSFIEKILFKISVKIYRSAWHKISYAMDDIYILVSYTYLCIWYSLLSILHVANMDLSHNMD